MARRYFVHDTTELIIGLTDDGYAGGADRQHGGCRGDASSGGPTGRHRADQGRREAWDGSAYTAPTGGGVREIYDPDTELGRRKIAATTLHQWFHKITAGIHAVRHEKPAHDVTVAEQFIAMGHHANYVVGHMSTIDIDQFEAWVVAMMDGAADITTIQSFFENAHTIDGRYMSRKRRALG